MKLFATDQPHDPRIAWMFTASPVNGTALQVANAAAAHLLKQPAGQRGIKFIYCVGTDSIDKAAIIRSFGWPETIVRAMNAWHRDFLRVLMLLGIQIDCCFVDEDLELGGEVPAGANAMCWYECCRSITVTTIRRIICEAFVEVYQARPFLVRYYDLLAAGITPDKNDNENAHSTVTGNSCLEAYTWTNDPDYEWRAFIRQRNQAAMLENPVLCIAPLCYAGDANFNAKIEAIPANRELAKTKLKHLTRAGVNEKAIYWNPPMVGIEKADRELADLLIPLKPSTPSKPLPQLAADASEIRTGTLVARRKN